MTVIAVDWSGAKSTGKLPGIWVTARRNGNVFVDQGSWTKTEAVDFVIRQPEPVVAGFDFSFGVPAWFAGELDCATIDDVWQWAARDGDDWLAPRPPFWSEQCVLPAEQQFRQCEAQLRAAGSYPTSVFQLVGSSQVGKGSVRGMPQLARLRAAGFTIWPFEGASSRFVVEIYPSLLSQRFPEFIEHDAPNTHARAARLSARAMEARADDFGRLTRALDPVERLEGRIWDPATSP